jgi:hypothetical protein
MRRVDAGIRWLANQAAVGRELQNPSYRAPEALFVLLAFLILTPLAGLLLFTLLQFVATIVEGMLESMGRILGLPARRSRRCSVFARALVFVGTAGLAYGGSQIWLPRCLWVLGLVARAYLTLRS